MASMLDAVIAALEGHLDRETDAGLHRSMHYPTTWDPLFTSTMTLSELHRYLTRPDTLAATGWRARTAV